jgi:hypothetical protein
MAENGSLVSLFNSQRVISGKNVYVVWQDNTLGNFEIFFKRSTDGGENFDTTKNISNSVLGSGGAQIAASGAKVYVVWQDTVDELSLRLVFTRSIDSGGNFDSPKTLAGDVPKYIMPKEIEDFNLNLENIFTEIGVEEREKIINELANTKGFFDDVKCKNQEIQKRLGKVISENDKVKRIISEIKKITI